MDQKLPEHVPPPEYATLLRWWDAWPEARPELLDFWARGNFTRRILSRRVTDSFTCIVRASSKSEMKAAVSRLALLDVDIDVAWTGPVSDPALVIVPQEDDFEGTGGWGYLTCAADRVSDRRGDCDWTPAMAWASLLPSGVTEWLATDARRLLQDGRLIVAPVEHVGLPAQPGSESETNLQALSRGASFTQPVAGGLSGGIQVELPYVRGLPIHTVEEICREESDSLVLLQTAVRKLLRARPSIDSIDAAGELIEEIRNGVAELRLSDRSRRTRSQLAALGGSIGTFIITVGVQLGAAPTAAVLGSLGAAMATLGLWVRSYDIDEVMQKSPFYLLWKFSKVKRRRGQKRRVKGLSAGRGEEIPPYHWLSPPTAGWRIPSAIRAG